jgi:hypothetical protein
MDRGIPTEQVLSEMRQSDPPVSYLVGTPKGRLTKLEKSLIGLPWQTVREGVDVKLLPKEQELYVLARSRSRIYKERAIRRRKLKWLWGRLKELSAMDVSREELLMKLGAARSKARAAWRLVDVKVDAKTATFTYALNRKKLRIALRREGRYLLRTNLTGRDPAQLWQFYIQLTEIEAAFKNLNMTSLWTMPAASMATLGSSSWAPAGPCLAARAGPTHLISMAVWTGRSRRSPRRTDVVRRTRNSKTPSTRWKPHSTSGRSRRSSLNAQ